MSIQNSLLRIIMRAVNAKKMFGKAFVNPPRGSNALNPVKFSPDRFTVSDNSIEGFRLLTLQPSGKEDHDNGHILFLHGGAYVLEAAKYHRLLIEKFVEKYNFSCSFFDYPLGPENDCEKTNRLTVEAYKFMTANFPGKEFFVFGDSAGGGLALSLIQQLRDLQIRPFPGKTVLQSPWTNLKMDNPEIGRFIKKDLMLDVDAAAAAARHYVKGRTVLENPKVSPYFGDMKNLLDIFLLYGTDEVLNPDCRLLAEKIEKAEGTSLKVEIGKNMMHDWVLFPMPESEKTVEEIASFYRS